MTLTDANVREFQTWLKALGLYTGAVDGLAGPLTRKAANEAVDALDEPIAVAPEVFTMQASSFADPADLAAFKRCKRTGKSDLECFRVGDNGIGEFGESTAQEHTAMVAVHRDAMMARWGSVNAAAHKPVLVTVGHVTINATVEDRISEPGRIDLNPGAAKRLGLKPPFLVPVTWRWA